MKKTFIIAFLAVNLTLIVAVFAFANAVDQPTAENKSEDQIKTSDVDNTKIVKYAAAAVAIAGATIASGIAVGKIGSAAMGAVSEKPEAGGTAMILAALAEGVCLWGIAGAVLILLL